MKCYRIGSFSEGAPGPAKGVPTAMVQTQRRYTVDDWADSPLNTPLAELVDGIPVERMATSGDHGEVANALWRWLDQAAQDGYGRMYAGPVGVVLDADGARRNVREPDFCFFRQGRVIRRTNKGIEGVPDLVVEILSPGNEEDDLPDGAAWDSYERFGVPYYWIVDPRDRLVLQYERRDSRLVEVGRLHSEDTLICPFFPDLPLPVGRLFVELDE